MFCKYCGYEYQNENVRFCPKCGRSIENEVVIVENVEPEHTEQVQTQEQIVYKPVTPPLNNPVNVNGGANVNTTQDPNTGQTVVYVTNEVKKGGSGCLGCLGWIFIILIVFSLLGSCAV